MYLWIWAGFFSFYVFITLLQTFNHSMASHLPFPPSCFLSTPHTYQRSIHTYVHVSAIYTFMCGHWNEGQHIPPSLPLCIAPLTWMLSEDNLKTREPPPLSLPHTPSRRAAVLVTLSLTLHLSPGWVTEVVNAEPLQSSITARLSMEPAHVCVFWWQCCCWGWWGLNRPLLGSLCFT